MNNKLESVTNELNSKKSYFMEKENEINQKEKNYSHQQSYTEYEKSLADE